MHISCSICSDLFVPLIDVFVTDCGHLFHYACLAQWIERSKSCPQCRSKTTEKSIHRIYFNIATCDADTEDTSVLNNKIDQLKFQLHLKETDIRNFTEETSKLKFQNAGLRDEIKKQDSKIRTLDSSIMALKDQVRYLKDRSKDAEIAREEESKLRKELEMCNNIKLIIQGTTRDVEDMIETHGDSYESRKSLVTYISVLKRELQATSEKKKQLNDRLKICERNASTLKIERRKLEDDLTEKVKLQEDLKYAENEIRNLRKKLDKLQKDLASPSGNNPKDRALQRLIMESPMPEVVKRPRLTDPAETSVSTLISALTSPEIKTEMHSYPSPETPVFSIKSIGVKSTKVRDNRNILQPLKGNKYSIFKRTQTLETNTKSTNVGEVYDGMGGHSKLDVFPTPNPRIKSAKFKTKKSVNSIGKSQLLIKSVNKLDQFFNV